MSDHDPELLARAERRIGCTLCSRYTIEGLLGIGGMATVFRGSHRNGNKVAIKILHAELSIAEDVRQRFLREGYVANKVEHRGVVRVLDDDVAEDGSVFLVMELLEGETLDSMLERAGGRLPPSTAIPLACQLLAVLETAHAKEIVHRDVKPDNLFVTTDGTLKVLDFGIARLADGSRTATSDGRILGTPSYMSPEQARGEMKLVDARTDVWAVGAILFRALSGQLVFDAETLPLTLVMAATQPPRRLREVAPGVRPQLADVVDRALAPRRDDRWPSASAMLEALCAVPIATADISSSDAHTTLEMTAPMMNRPSSAKVPTTVTATAPLVKPARPASAPLDSLFEDVATELQPPLPHVLVPARRPTTTDGVARPARHAPEGPPLRLVAVLGAATLAGALVGVVVHQLGATPEAEAPASPQAAITRGVQEADGLAREKVFTPHDLPSSDPVDPHSLPDAAHVAPPGPARPPSDMTYDAALQWARANVHASEGPTLSDPQLAAPMRTLGIAHACGASVDTKLLVRVVVYEGRAIGVTAVPTPPDAGVATCVRRHVFGLSWPRAPFVDAFTTTY